MTDFRMSALAFLCVAGLLALAGPVAGAAASTAADGDTAAVSENETNGSSMGAEISAFMQSSASETDGAVENGMFEAAYENGTADDRTDLVRNRTGDLRDELADLRERRQRLQENRENMSQVEYQARMSRLVNDIRSLERAANRTEPLAEEAGVNTTSLREIRSNASNLTGEEVSTLAQQMAVVPDHVDRGPPEDRGQGNESAGQSDDRGSGEGTESTGQSVDNDGQGSSNGAQTDDDDSEDDEGNDNSGSGNGGGNDGRLTT
jgi:molecular chaperone GrpE (heat shock protein)